MPKPVVLCILDGWGWREEREANAVALAATPVFDGLMQFCPHTTLSAHGEDVGLPEGQMGNSEVGHMNIGAGRVVWMDLPRINNAISDGSFAKNAVLAEFAEKVKSSGGTVHLAGLLSDGGVHSHMAHMVETAHVLCEGGLQLALHVFLDGRDVAPKSALGYVERLENELPEDAAIATVTGRFFAMDRDKRWDRVEAAFRCMVQAEGERVESARAAINSAYERGETDEFVSPSVVGDYAGMRDGDGLLFTNFRADRAREILGALLDPSFDGFDASAQPAFVAACGMVEYSDDLNAHMDVIFPAQEIVNTFGDWLAKHGKAQFRLAETEKYPHVTFFLNGGVETAGADETRYMAPSPKVRTYDLAPEMSAGEVSDQLVAAITGQGYDAIVVNYANPDMVGHTGDLEAAIAACEAVDAGLGRAVEALRSIGGAMIVTADHGNCEVMVDPETGGPHTAHTTNPVPVILVNGPDGATMRDGGRLADLAPSLLDLMEVEQPPEMSGESLIVR